MLATLCLVTGLLVGQPAAATPANEQAARLEQEVLRLVRLLDDRELAQREAAEKELVGLGPAALAHLPQANNKMPAEIRQRLARVRTALESRAAETNLAGTTVTLSGEMSLNEALQAVQKQTGNALSGYEGRTATVQTDFKDSPFWPALDRLLDQANLNVDPYGGQPNTLVLVARPEDQPSRLTRAAYDGAFRVEPLRLFALRDFKNPEADAMRVALSVSWEPRLAPVTIYQALDAFQAEDEQGQVIAVGPGPQRLEFTVRPGMSGIEYELPLALPARSVTQIAKLTGKLSAVIPGRMESFEFVEDLSTARGVQNRKGAVTVILDEVNKNLDLFQVRVRIRFDDAAGALESHRGWVYSNEAFLVDAQNQQIAHAGLELTRQSDNEVGINYLFDLPSGIKGCKFVYKSPASMLEREISYELKGLELP